MFKWCSYCDNETVDGVEFPNFPKYLEPQAGEDERLVAADMSSNFLSHRVDMNKYAVIFGGAQTRFFRVYITRFMYQSLWPETRLVDIDFKDLFQV